MMCCGQKMTELVPNTVDASQEKHVPAVTVSGYNVSVKVGNIEHPMSPEHSIAFIYLQTVQGGQRKSFEPGMKPATDFALAGGDRLMTVYAYCNLHGLWKADI